MNIEELKDGKYLLLECKSHLDEFELTITNGKLSFQKNNYGKLSKIEDNEFLLLCDLHESEDWEIY